MATIPCENCGRPLDEKDFPIKCVCTQMNPSPKPKPEAKAEKHSAPAKHGH